MPYSLPPLPYPDDALAPTTDELTMRVRRDKHHAGYVADLNAAIEGTEWADRELEPLLADVDVVDVDERAVGIVDWRRVAERHATAPDGSQSDAPWLPR
jgi:Fe-Mn family superoxide dismutase